MREFRYIWIVGLVVTALIVIIPIALLAAPAAAQTSDPWDNLPAEIPHTDHTGLFEGPLETGSDVTRACLECHEDSALQVMATSHWTWESEPVQLANRDEPVTVGKANSINNFCIGIRGNEQGCTRCHAGYGWSDDSFDFAEQSNVDCLVCHDQSGTYVKAGAGLPAEGVDLLAVAESVASPTRENCGGCHFNGGGGNGVKHGDLDESLYYPPESVDVHMGRYDFQCVSCHQTEDHQISGRSISVSLDNANQVYCTDCHETTLHEDDRIATHIDSVACQTCHIPAGAVREPTKMEWDWSAAGDDSREEDPHEYLKIKGSFVYESEFVPDYIWYNGLADRYILGDEIDPDAVTPINLPYGSIDDATAQIWPFKTHYAIMPYDVGNSYLLQPKTVGEGGYWTEFDWDLALRLGAEATGIPYSGSYGWTETEMYWPQAHMVAPASAALQCTDCHGDEGRMDWEALGYYGDPLIWGGR